MKPLFDEKINKSLKKYQPIEVILRQNCDKCGHQYDLYSLKMDMNTKTVANVKFKDWLMKNTKRNKQKKLDYIFNQSNVNPSTKRCNS